MRTPFGPQLIGETEKALGALLRKVLEGVRAHRASMADAPTGRGGHQPRAVRQCGRPRQRTFQPRLACRRAPHPGGTEPDRDSRCEDHRRDPSGLVRANMSVNRKRHGRRPTASPRLPLRQETHITEVICHLHALQ